jgi:sugar diacid utilization regulator
MAECGWSKQRYHQIKKFSEIKKALPPKSQQLLTSESQARELGKHPQEKHVEILNEAVQFHAKDGEITAKSIERAAVTLEPVDQTDFPIPSGDASYYWSLLPQGKELASKMHAIGLAIKELDKDDIMWRQCDLASVLTDLRNAWKRFKGGLPAYVCTKCGGVKPKGCDFCKGRGTVGTWAWRNCGDDKHAIERAVREARKKNGNA